MLRNQCDCNILTLEMNEAITNYNVKIAHDNGGKIWFQKCKCIRTGCLKKETHFIITSEWKQKTFAYCPRPLRFLSKQLLLLSFFLYSNSFMFLLSHHNRIDHRISCNTVHWQNKIAMERSDSFYESTDFGEIKHFKNPFDVINDKIAVCFNQWQSCTLIAASFCKNIRFIVTLK